MQVDKMKCYLILHSYLRQRLLFAVCLLSFFIMSSCAFPSNGWYSRMENKSEMSLFTLKKIDENTKALVKNTGNKTVIKDWKKSLTSIPKPAEAPSDNNSGDWVETLLYVLLGMSGLGGLGKGASFLYKIKPKD